ncbi:MAG TPA: sensor domain-containing protein [Mycobacterium sp.]|nr:sensor domain-containing protein [Mycobacterium sp.]
MTPGGYPTQPFGGYPPPGPGGYPPPPPYPPARTNTLATWSVVFAFLFAPVGAVLGHVALGQIKRTRERGHDRALIGVTLSYVVIVLAVVGLTASLIMTNKPTDSPPVATATPTSELTAPPAPGQRGRTDLSGVLLSLDEVREIMGMPGLSEKKPKQGGSREDDKDVSAEPAECVGAVAPGIDTVYERSGGNGFRSTNFNDSSTATMVEQVAASFDDEAKARSFVSQNRTQWQKCARKQFSITSADTTLRWDLGTPGGTTTKVTLKNTLDAGPGVPQLRVLATRGNVVIDISVVSLKATDEAEVIADKILDRIPS